jgi:Rrf2 family protein
VNSEFTIAVHSLVLLAYRPDHMATSEMIAHNVCTHPARVRKVMGCLRKQGYVAAKEGIGGGFILMCDPKIVTLADIYALTSAGYMQPGWCSGSDEQECIVACSMAAVMRGVYSDAEQQLVGFFRRLTIQDVLNRIKGEVAAPD